MVAKALDVPVRDLFDSVESGDFSTAVSGLDARAEDQQRSRKHEEIGWLYLYIGSGVIVTLVTIILINTVLPGAAFLIVPSYWIGGIFVYWFLRRVVLGPRLDAKYPLTAGKPTTAR